jgi:hypothetical protein
MPFACIVNPSPFGYIHLHEIAKILVEKGPGWLDGVCTGSRNRQHHSSSYNRLCRTPRTGIHPGEGFWEGFVEAPTHRRKIFLEKPRQPAADHRPSSTPILVPLLKSNIVISGFCLSKKGNSAASTVSGQFHEHNIIYWMRY